MLKICGVTTLALMAVVFLLALLGDETAFAQPNLIAELIRKAEAGEVENGYCATVAWPGITRVAYVRWLEDANVGTIKVNKFSGGDCEYNNVTRISSRNGRKCVHYDFYRCIPGQRCAKGAETDCKQASGDWTR